jgi:uncharacterized protein
MSQTESAQIISGLAEFFAKGMRTPILRRPDEYGMAYEAWKAGSSSPIPAGS